MRLPGAAGPARAGGCGAAPHPAAVLCYLWASSGNASLSLGLLVAVVLRFSGNIVFILGVELSRLCFVLFFSQGHAFLEGKTKPPAIRVCPSRAELGASDGKGCVLWF